ncbi:MAG: hypothetical protein FJ109_03610 [Deltaproteobacteria bacterium]|nr:hypothetical protein [Deltaproteobacteria bacterium]
MPSDSTEKRALDAVALKEKFDSELDQLDNRISRLRVTYHQYFMGIEKLEPTYQRKEIQKVFNVSQILKLGSTVHRFRYRAMQQKFTSYSSYWDRIVRLIEEGRIRRGVNEPPPLGEGPDVPSRKNDVREGIALPLAARRRRFVRDRKGPAPGAGAPGAAPAAGSAPPGPAPVAAGAPPRSDFDPGETEAIFRQLVEEKRRAGEPVDKLSASVVAKSVERIVQQLGRGDLRFRVLNRDGKVSLTAVVKKT